MEFSGLWTTGTSGDGATTYNQSQLSKLFKALAACHGYEGVAPNYLNELVGSVPGANTARISTGAAMVDGKMYYNDANVDVTIPSAAAGLSRIDRIVLRADWSAYTVRITRIAGTDAASPVAPAITQTSEATYDIMLYQATVTDAGVVTLSTDERVFANVTAAKTANRTRILFVPVVSGYNLTDTTDITRITVQGWPAADDKNCYFWGNFRVPADFSSAMTVTAILIPGASANCYCGLTQIRYGAVGESFFNHNNDQALAAVPLTDAVINTLSAVSLPNAAAGDYVSLEFNRDATSELDTIGTTVYIMGFLVSYTADS